MDQMHPDFACIHKASKALLEMFMRMHVVDNYDGIAGTATFCVTAPSTRSRIVTAAHLHT